MTPVETAAALYEKWQTLRSFREDMEAHLLHGMVFSTPTCFMLGRMVSTLWEPEQAQDPYFNDDKPKDCILIYLASGDMKELFTFPIKKANWVAFSRIGKPLRIYPYSAIKNHLTSWAASSED